MVEIVSIVDEGLGHSSYVVGLGDGSALATPDHLAYLLVSDGAPVALFSGGSLMVGALGRTDLLGDEHREELARDLFRALRAEILTLPEHLPVDPAVVDVRQDPEWAGGHLPDAMHVELGDLAGATMPDGPVTVMCGHGERAMTGVSLLEAADHRGLSVLFGGPDDWHDATGIDLQTG